MPSLSSIVSTGRGVDVSLNLEGRGVMCLGRRSRHYLQRIFAGTFDRGIYRSRDGGDVWESVGSGMADARVLSIAISPCDRVNGRSVVYAGTEPSKRFFARRTTVRHGSHLRP